MKAIVTLADRTFEVEVEVDPPEGGSTPAQADEVRLTPLGENPAKGGEARLRLRLEPTADHRIWRLRLHAGGRSTSTSTSTLLAILPYGTPSDSEASPGLAVQLWWRGQVYPVRVEGAAEHALRRHLQAADRVGRAGQAVVANMPGLIVHVRVREGQRVRRGEGLVVIEAMKMENELRAPHDGIVRRLSVRPGQQVDKGQRLCYIDIDADADAEENLDEDETPVDLRGKF